MNKTMIIEGMMCEHCQATVKKALEKVPGVESAEVSYQDGKAVLTLNAPVENSALVQAVEDRDYKVLEVIDE